MANNRGYGRNFKYDPAFVEQAKANALAKRQRKNAWRSELASRGGFYNFDFV